MDTKSTSFKHSLACKALCLLLSVLFMFGSIYFTVLAAAKIYVNGTMKGITSNDNSFYSSGALGALLAEDVHAAAVLAGAKDINALNNVFVQNKKRIIDAAVDEYLNQKAAIIEAELLYAVTHDDEYYFLNGEPYEYDEYDDGYDDEPIVRFDESDSETSAVTTTAVTQAALPQGEPETEPRRLTEPVTRVAVTPDASKAIRAAENALNTAKGQEFLKYAYLVRESAFVESSYEFNYSLDEYGLKYSGDMSCAFTFDEAGVRERFTDTYDSQHIMWYDELNYIIKRSIAQLSSLVNVRYYISTDGSQADAASSGVYTNMESYESIIASFDSSYGYLTYKDGVLYQKGLDDYVYNGDKGYFNYVTGLDKIITANVASNPKALIVFCLSDAIEPGDNYYDLNQFFLQYNCTNGSLTEIVLALVLLVLAIVTFVILLCLSGHKNGVDGIALSFIDKLPTDIHFILSWGIVAGLIFCVSVGAVGFILGNTSFVTLPKAFASLAWTKLAIYATGVIGALGWLVIIEWFASVVRIKKAGKSWLRKCVGIALCVWIVKKTGQFVSKVFTLLSYKPSKFKRNVVLIAVLFLGVNSVLALLFACFLACSVVFWAFLTALVFIAFNVFVIIKITAYIKQLDGIICAASDRSIVLTDAVGYSPSLRILADSLKVTQDELNAAVESALRDERMKTELITNVSHDLKTPLTSVINYVDLLRKCGITDPTALGYLDVLDEKSTRLKHLVEDLVEASKASSGTVTLNKTSINLTELTIQAIGEMSEDFENYGLDVKLSSPDEAPIIYADSQKTYRVIDNLLTNAKKYSATGSRVYVTVDRGLDCGIFEVKNISGEPLNISAEELMERFVRGDSSRTDGGSGLGLSIARDLCILQGGELTLSIDGDLFKATVRLPLFRGFNQPSQEQAAEQ